MDAVEAKAAQDMLDAAVESLGADPSEDDRETFVTAIRKGRLDFDEQSETFSVYLRKPIELDNGDTVAKLELSEPTACQMRVAGKSIDEFEQSLLLIGYLAGQPVSVIERMGSRDLTLTSRVLGFFV